MDLDNLQTIRNEATNRFELQVGEHLAFIDYKIGRSGDMYMVHTEVPKELGGQGVGKKVVVEPLAIAEKEDFKIVPNCPYVRAYIKRHFDAYKHLVSDRYRWED